MAKIKSSVKSSVKSGAKSIANPRITLQMIQQEATAKSLDRGKSYYSQDSIYNAMRQGFRLWANCSGSEEYETSVTLKKDGIQTSHCTCPYDWGGLCKHQVALLLTYLNDPDRFEVIEPLSELLKSSSREDLIQLIETMVEESPNLLSLISQKSNASQPQPINLSIYQKQIKKAFRLQEMYPMAKALNGIVRASESLREAGNWQDSGRLYQLLLEQSIEVYDGEILDIDYNGEVACVIQEIIQGLVDCLGQAEENNDQTELTEIWLTTLLDAIFKNIELGGMDFDAGAWEGIVAYAQEEDWDWISSIIREQIQAPGIGQWGQESLVRLLIEASQHSDDEDAEQRITQELGSLEQKVALFAKQGKWDEAIELAKGAIAPSPGFVLRLADQLLAVDLPNQAVAYVLAECEKDLRGWKIDEWLENYYCKFGTSEQAIEWTMKRFKVMPSLEGYLKLKALHPQKKAWKTLQNKLFQQLETQNRVELWIDILLAEEDLDRAIELLAELKSYQQHSCLIKVAKVAEKQKPKAAIEIYQTIVTNLISNKNRSAYQQATEYLKTLRSVYESIEPEFIKKRSQ